MDNPSFAVYLYPQVCLTSKPVDQIRFIGHSVPYFDQVREALEKKLNHFPSLPLRKARYENFLSVHTEEYLDKLTRMAAEEKLSSPPRLSMECMGYEYCLPGYLYGLGGLMEAIDQMKAGGLKRAYCFSLGGHHAYADWGHGYCLLNPPAAAARYAQDEGFSKILIVDWDIHHGDGTQSIFANDSSVYCISIHSAADLYMSIMRVIRDGTTTRGEALGHCNIPLLDITFGDDFFTHLAMDGRFFRAYEGIDAFQSALEKIPWTPDLIMIFSGYDSHKNDCGEGITDWVDEDYQRLTRCVLRLAEEADCPVLSTHGGGYILPVTVEAAISHIEVLADDEHE